MNNAIVDFYLNTPNDQRIPTIDYVLKGCSYDLENCHTWCQRAFPNYEPSEVVPGSPVLDDETLDFLKRTQKEKILELVFRYLRHYSEIPISEFQHNNLRVTRLLKFLVMLGYTDVARTVHMYCVLVYANNFGRQHVNMSMVYWIDALNYKRENNNETI